MDDRQRPAQCPKCQGPATFILSIPAAKPGWDPAKEWTNFGDKPVKFGSRREFLQTARENGFVTGEHS